MKRIAQISLHGDPLEPLGSIEAGGQNVYVRNVAASIARAGVEVDVFTRWNNPAKPRVEAIAPGARVIRLHGGPRDFLKKEKLLGHLPQMLDDFEKTSRQQNLRYDVIHTHYYVEGAFGMEVARRTAVPHLHTFHSLGRIKYNHERLQGNPDPADYEERFRIEQLLMSRCDRLVATSPCEAQDFHDWYAHSNSNTAVVPCGFDPSLFSPMERGRARAQLGLPADRTLLLYVGRLDPRKGLEALLFAYRKLLFDLGREGDHLLLVVVGGNTDPDASDPETLHFRRLAASLQLEERGPSGEGGQVLFAGSQSQEKVALFYAAADVAVVPSCYEPFGMVAIEAQACGTPVVASAVGGLRYGVADGVGGLLVKPYSPCDLSEKLERLVRDADLRRELGRRGQARVLKLFTWDSVSRELLSCYREVAGQARVRIRPVGAPPRPVVRKGGGSAQMRDLPFFATNHMMGGVPGPSPASAKP